MVHFAACVEIARGVIGVTDEDGACVFVDERLKLFDFGERESLFDGGGDGSDACTGRDGKRHVVGVGRLRHNDFIAGIQTGHESKEHGFRTAGSDDDVVRVKVDVIFFIVVREFLTITSEPLTGTVLQYFPVEVLEDVQSCLRCWEVRLTDVQMIDVDSPLFGCRGERSQLSDG